MNSSLLCAPPQLMLRLCQTAELEATALSSRSFGVTPASIALSEHIRVAFSPRGTQEGLHNVLGHQQLSSSGATTLQVWNRIATAPLD